MIPAQKPCKSFIRHKKDFSLVAEIMERYLDKWGCSCGTFVTFEEIILNETKTGLQQMQQESMSEQREREILRKLPQRIYERMEKNPSFKSRATEKSKLQKAFRNVGKTWENSENKLREMSESEISNAPRRLLESIQSELALHGLPHDLTQIGERKTKSKQFAEKYFESMIEKTLSGEERVVLPHNLGYLQVLEHKCAIHEKEFGEKNNGLDWSLIWVRHPMFVHHRIKMGKELREKVREKKKQGIKYLTDYVDGDTYVIE